MLKILNTAQLRELDSVTTRYEPVASIDLMERACTAFVGWFAGRFSVQQPVQVICGTGNNGGDGLGIARLLQKQGYEVHVCIVRGGTKESADFKMNLDRLPAGIKTTYVTLASDLDAVPVTPVLIDAIFGTGLSRPATGVYADTIRWINNTAATRVAVDIPSGLSADEPSTGEIVRADYTVTFQLPKLSFLFPQSNAYVGAWHVVNIGLNQQFVQDAPGKYFLLEHHDIRKRIKQRSRFDHKGTFGHALLVAGSYGSFGAAILGARAALRSGVGLLTVHVPRTGYEVMQLSVPEAMVQVDAHSTHFSQSPQVQSFSSVGVGPGLGRQQETVVALTKLLQSATKPLLIDADALNILAANRELVHLVPKNSILTPHPKEFERLVGAWKNDFERLQKQVDFAARTGTVVLLKGAYSSIVSPGGNVFFNNTGNPGMATGGSGDVLTGIITALLAQGYASLDATLVGCWVHGAAGDLAAAQKGQISMIASDIIDYLPQAFRMQE